MTFFRRHGRAWTWIALWAMLALSLSPTLSHALAGSNAQAPWNQICTAHAPDGGEALRSTTPPPAPDAPLGHLEHCPYCALGAVDALPPAAPLAGLPVAPATGACPAPSSVTPWPDAAWRAAPARAPPTQPTQR